MKLEWVIVFDWDGTLIDSLPLKIRNAGQLFEETFGVSRKEVETSYRVHSGISRRQLFDAICSDNDLPALTSSEFDNLSETFSNRNLEAFSNIRVDPVVITTLSTLKDFGYPLFISTATTPEEVRSAVKSLELDSHFQGILGSQGEFTKGPAHIAYIMAKIPVEKESIWFVGDEPNDVVLGKQAGVRTIVKVGSHSIEALKAAQPDRIIGNLSELIPLFERN